MANEEDEQLITKEQGSQIMLDCYNRGNDESFGDCLRRKIQDPIQPRDEEYRLRLHPLLLSLIVYGGIGMSIFLAFTFWHWHK
jgi:hypothetical protein